MKYQLPTNLRILAHKKGGKGRQKWLTLYIPLIEKLHHGNIWNSFTTKSSRLQAGQHEIFQKK